jgi:hypothetical protein
LNHSHAFVNTLVIASHIEEKNSPTEFALNASLTFSQASPKMLPNHSLTTSKTPVIFCQIPEKNSPTGAKTFLIPSHALLNVFLNQLPTTAKTFVILSQIPLKNSPTVEKAFLMFSHASPNLSPIQSSNDDHNDSTMFRVSCQKLPVFSWLNASLTASNAPPNVSLKNSLVLLHAF